MMLEWLLSPLTTNAGSRSWRRRETAPSRVTRMASEASSVPSLRSALPRLGGELNRARRYERPLCLLVTTLHYYSDGEEGDGEAGWPHEPGGEEGAAAAEVPVHHPVALLAGWVLRDMLRESDSVSYDAVGQRFVVVLSESGKEEARRALGRIERIMHERMWLRIRSGIAVFPDDGFTITDLLEQAEAAWLEAPVTSATESSG